MFVEKLLTLLLPLGAWLILSASSSRSHDTRFAVSGLLALTLTTLTFFAVGYAFMFGGIGTATGNPAFSRFVTYYSVPIDAQNWGVIGLRGFLLADATSPTSIDLFITYLPLVLTGAIILTSLMTPHSSVLSQAIAVLIISGLLIPLVGFWMWGGGWLSALGTNLSLGHGAVDFGGLTSVALVAGGAGLAWLITTPKYADVESDNVPVNSQPTKAMTGVFCLLIGAACFISNNPLFSFGQEAASIGLVNSLLAASTAVVVIYLYTVFVMRKPDLTTATRGVLAAVIAMAAGGITLPYGTAVVVGILCALLVIAGLYISNHIQRWRDGIGIVGTVLAPAIIGSLAVGLSATGAYGKGWNGVGITEYLGTAHLGVVGSLPIMGNVYDPGQLTAQLAATGVILVIAILLFLPIALVLPRTINDEVIRDVVVGTTPKLRAAKRKQQILPEEQTQVAEVVSAANMQLTDLPIQEVKDAAADPVEEDVGKASTDKAPAKESLLDRLRKARIARTEPEPPSQAKHVAYPSRIGGRRFAIRPTTKNGDSETAEDVPVTR
jgi:ammonium transporter, Amt family